MKKQKEKPPLKSKLVGVFVEPPLYAKLKQAAAKDERSISGFIRVVLIDRLEKSA